LWKPANRPAATSAANSRPPCSSSAPGPGPTASATATSTSASMTTRNPSRSWPASLTCGCAAPRDQAAMSELTRISISLETGLVEAFDRRNAGHGYPTRSEAIRDLIRDRLIQEQAIRGSETDPGQAERVAVLTLVYDHHARELAARLIDKQH